MNKVNTGKCEICNFIETVEHIYQLQEFRKKKKRKQCIIKAGWEQNIRSVLEIKMIKVKLQRLYFFQESALIRRIL